MNTLSVAAALQCTTEGAGAITPAVRQGLSLAFPVEARALAQHRVVLSDDSPLSVPVPAGANVVMVALSLAAEPVRARLSTGSGALQAVPVAPVALLVFRGDALTALDLTRSPGSETTADVFLGVL